MMKKSFCSTLLATALSLTAFSSGSMAIPDFAAQETMDNFRTQIVLLPGHNEPSEITFEVKDGYAIFQGDINLGGVDDEGYLIQDGLSEEGEFTTEAVVIDDPDWDHRWPDGVIPYEITGNWGSKDKKIRNAIDDAMDHWEEHTPIRFVQRTNEQFYVDFVKVSDGCTATPGYWGDKKKHVVSLASKCDTLRATVHELGHVVGLWHEQSREDRDSYVEVKEENIIGGIDGYQFAFDPHIEDGKDIGPYDYNSIMHYRKDAFAIDRATCVGYSQIPPSPPKDLSKCTIITLDPAYQDVIGATDRLSDLDIAAVDQLYGFTPMDLYYSGARGDNFTAVSSTGVRDAKNAGYYHARTQGYLNNQQLAGTVPLKLWWHGGRGDNFSSATTTGERDARNAGYRYVRTQGYVFTSRQPGTVPLKLWWHGGRGDNFSSATTTGDNAARNAGYRFVRTQGYIYP